MRRREFLAAMASSGFLGSIGCARQRQVSRTEDLIYLDTIDQAALVAGGDVSAAELIEAAIARIEKIDPVLNAVVTNAFERARERIAKNQTTGRLWGAPYLLKDLNAYEGVRFTRGSKLFIDAIAKSQTPYTDKIEDAGLIVLGKTNTPEFGLISTTESLALGPAKNPWNTHYSTGGSSGGSAAAVASRMVPAAQASDGGGSIRIPASQCGVFGLKPSRGRFPVQMTSPRPWRISIKHAVSISVRDSALILALTERGDGSVLEPTGFVEPGRTESLKIALTKNAGNGVTPSADVAAAIDGAGRLLESMGHVVDVVENTPMNDPDIAEHFLLHWAQGASELAEIVSARTGMPAEDTGLLEPFTLGLAKMFDAQTGDVLPVAIETFRETTARVDTFLSRYDVWLTPVTSTSAPKLGEQGPLVDFDTLLERVSRFAAYTPIHNIAGTPAMSVPFAFSNEGLPIGVQLSSRLGNEKLLLRLAYDLENARPWAEKLPRVHA